MATFNGSGTEDTFVIAGRALANTTDLRATFMWRELW